MVYILARIVAIHYLSVLCFPRMDLSAIIHQRKLPGVYTITVCQFQTHNPPYSITNNPGIHLCPDQPVNPRNVSGI